MCGIFGQVSKIKINKTRITKMSDTENVAISLDRNGLISWGFDKLSRSTTTELVLGSGVDYMDELSHYSVKPDEWIGVRPWNNYSYIHNPFLGTFLMYGLCGFLFSISFVFLPMLSLLLTRHRETIAITIPLLSVLILRASMSGNTIFSPIILCVFLLICVSIYSQKNVCNCRKDEDLV